MSLSFVDITASLEREDLLLGEMCSYFSTGWTNTARRLTISKATASAVKLFKKALTSKDEEALIGSSVFSQYEQRLFEYVGLSVDVLDLASMQEKLLVLVFG